MSTRHLKKLALAALVLWPVSAINPLFKTSDSLDTRSPSPSIENSREKSVGSINKTKLDAEKKTDWNPKNPLEGYLGDQDYYTFDVDVGNYLSGAFIVPHGQRADNLELKFLFLRGDGNLEEIEFDANGLFESEDYFRTFLTDENLQQSIIQQFADAMQTYLLASETNSDFYYADFANVLAFDLFYRNYPGVDTASAKLGFAKVKFGKNGLDYLVQFPDFLIFPRPNGKLALEYYEYSTIPTDVDFQYASDGSLSSVLSTPYREDAKQNILKALVEIQKRLQQDRDNRILTDGIQENLEKLVDHFGGIYPQDDSLRANLETMKNLINIIRDQVNGPQNTQQQISLPRNSGRGG